MRGVILRVMLCIVALLGSVNAWADFPKETKYRVRDTGLPLVSTKEQACQDWSAIYTSGGYSYMVSNWNYNGGQYCELIRIGGSHKPLKVYDTVMACPANSAEVGGQCRCAADFVEDGGQCWAGCDDKEDQLSNRMVQTGWARWYPDGTGQVPLQSGGTANVLSGPAAAPATICSGGCRMRKIGGVLDNWVESGSIAGQTVPMYSEFQYQFTGGICGADPDFTGTVAGPRPPDGGASGPAAGDGGKGDPGQATDPGDKPGTSGSGQGGGAGEGSGSGPGSGEGGAAGSGAGPGKGGGIGGGIVNDNNAERLCGVGDLPPCNTLIDETGTATDGGERMSTEDLNHEMTKLDNVLPGIYERGDKDTSWGVVPAWFDSASCTPWDFGEFIGGINLTVDYCPAVPYAKGAASFMWLVVTFFAVLALVFRSVGGAS